MGATNSAYLFYLKGDYDKALNFIKEAEFVNEKNQFRDKSNIYSIYGLILLKTNNREEAFKLFNKSIEVNDSKIFLSSLMNTYRGYGLYDMEEGDWNNAIKNFKKGLNISYEMNHAIYRCNGKRANR